VLALRLISSELSLLTARFGFRISFCIDLPKDFFAELSCLHRSSEMISWVLNGLIASNVIKCLPVALPYGFRIVQVLQILPCIAARCFLGFPFWTFPLRVSFQNQGSILCVRSFEPFCRKSEDFLFCGSPVGFSAQIFPVFRCFKFPRALITAILPQQKLLVPSKLRIFYQDFRGYLTPDPPFPVLSTDIS